MTAMMEWLAEENARRAVPDRLLAAVPIIKACALGLLQVPELNGHFLDDRPVRIAEVKMGIGIALRGGGLIAPALALPDRLSLTEIMQRLSDLVARVREAGCEFGTEATVTLSQSLGDNSVDMVLPVIYPPQVIIGVSQIVHGHG
jgi:pyruvate dehydrogenase E2 component (dihydrolipoamide acetyltransferase)